MLQIRLAAGISKNSLSQAELLALTSFLQGGFLVRSAWERGTVVLSTTGRLIADRIVREILL